MDTVRLIDSYYLYAVCVCIYVAIDGFNLILVEIIMIFFLSDRHWFSWEIKKKQQQLTVMYSTLTITFFPEKNTHTVCEIEITTTKKTHTNLKLKRVKLAVIFCWLLFTLDFYENSSFVHVLMRCVVCWLTHQFMYCASNSIYCWYSTVDVEFLQVYFIFKLWKWTNQSILVCCAMRMKFR